LYSLFIQKNKKLLYSFAPAEANGYLNAYPKMINQGSNIKNSETKIQIMPIEQKFQQSPNQHTAFIYQVAPTKGGCSKWLPQSLSHQ